MTVIMIVAAQVEATTTQAADEFKAGEEGQEDHAKTVQQEVNCRC